MRKGFIIVTVVGIFLLLLVPIIFYSILTLDKKIVKKQTISSIKDNDRTIVLLNILRAPCKEFSEYCGKDDNKCMEDFKDCKGIIADYIVRQYLKEDKDKFSIFKKVIYNFLNKDEHYVPYPSSSCRYNLDLYSIKDSNIKVEANINVRRVILQNPIFENKVSIPVIGSDKNLMVRLYGYYC